MKTHWVPARNQYGFAEAKPVLYFPSENKWKDDLGFIWKSDLVCASEFEAIERAKQIYRCKA
jgi:hypothetical protein